MKLDAIADALGTYVAGLDPECMSGADAVHLVEVAARCERLSAAAKVLMAKRAVVTRAWARTSHAARPEQWFANVCGVSESAARQALAIADRLDELPATEERLRSGKLSVAQAAQVTAGASVDPSAEPRLLLVAERKGMRELCTERERVVAAATDEDKARALAHRERHVRTWTKGYATHGSFSGPTDEVELLLAALKPGEKIAYEHGRKTDHHEGSDAYRFDALIALAGRTSTALSDDPDGSDTKADRSRGVTRIRIDLNSLLSGRTEPGEVCEIPGVGPVPVSHARKVLSHGLLELVITDGVDVQTVVSTTRHVPNALRIAIEERDPTCKIRDCGADQHLHRHHIDEYAKHRRTTYKILGRLCRPHHDLVTHRGYEIIDHGDGTWSLRAPPIEDAA
jgi:hypothetical protein